MPTKAKKTATKSRRTKISSNNISSQRSRVKKTNISKSPATKKRVVAPKKKKIASVKKTRKLSASSSLAKRPALKTKRTKSKISSFTISAKIKKPKLEKKIKSITFKKTELLKIPSSTKRQSKLEINPMHELEKTKTKTPNLSKTSVQETEHKKTFTENNQTEFTDNQFPYMGPEHMQHYRDKLLEMRQTLVGNITQTVHHLQDEATSLPDLSDRATHEEGVSLELRARDRQGKLIKKIEEALKRLDEGDYGYCEACGVEIGIRRLEARPTATLCIDCKTLAEIKEKQSGG